MAKYPQVRSALKARLLAGHYREGRALPSEAELASEFAVSRMTVRRALDELATDGYLVREQGSGTYPTGRHFSQGTFRIVPLDELAGEAGVSTRVLAARLEAGGSEATRMLGLPPGAAVVRIERLRAIAGRPVLLERRFLPADVGERLLARSLLGESLHDMLVAELGVPVDTVTQELSAANLEAADAASLGMAAGAATLVLRRFSRSGARVVSAATYLVRPDAGVFSEAFQP